MNRMLSVLTSSLLFILSGAAAMAAPAEERVLAAVDQQLRQVENNLKLAQETLGPEGTTVAASKAKLAAVRLGQAAAAMPAVEAAMAPLAGDDQAVAAMRARLATTAEAINRLQERLSGKPAAAGAVVAGAAVAGAGGSGEKLDYRQEEQLRAADFNVREVEGNLQALQELVKRLMPIADQSTIDFRQVAAGMNTVANAERKAGFAEESLRQLPGDGKGVEDVRRRLDEARKGMGEAVAYLRPLQEKLSTLVSPASYPQLPNDLRRLRDLAMMYNNPEVLQTRLEDGIVLLTQREAVAAESKRIASQYQALILQKTEEGKQVEGAASAFSANFQAFATAAERRRAALPDEVRGELATAERLAAEAAKSNNVLPFTGGIPEAIARAEERLALLRLLDAEAEKALRGAVAATKSGIEQQQAALRAMIVESTPVPPDRYGGSDRQLLIDRATASWQQLEKTAKVIKAVIPSQQWSRTTRWEYASGTWTFVDYSRVQAQLLVAHDETTAVIRPINLTKDHQRGDELRAVPLDTLGDQLIPQRYLLLAKLK